MKKLTVILVILFWMVVNLSRVFAQNPGDILINEVMQNPNQVSDANGEWFELYNNTDTPIDINGWVIKDNGTDNHTINNGGPLYVPARSYLVLGRNGEYSTNGGYYPDYVYSGIILGNDDDEIILIHGTVEINRIEYDGGTNWPDPDGASMGWDGIGSNNDGTRWHEESTATYGDGDYGTPGSWNTGSAIAVELTAFNAFYNNEGVLLTWTTQTETENFGFHVYRSKTENGKYANISRELIKGAGNSDQARTYSYTDKDVEAGNTYYYKLADIDFNGNMNFHWPISVTVNAQPTGYSLAQNYPNPFNSSTTINFTLKQKGNVTLKIYNLQGQMIYTLVEEDKPIGTYSMTWNGTDENGCQLPSSVYYYTLKVNEFKDTKKLIFMK